MDDAERDLALYLRVACRPDWSLKNLALSGVSLRAINNTLPEMHDASHTTVVLKSGLRLGLLKGVA